MPFCVKSDVLNQDGSLKDVITLRKENTKGNKTRQIPFVHKKVISVLKEYLEFRKENNDNEPLDMQSPLFVSQRNGRFSRQTMSELFKVMFRKVGLSEECYVHLILVKEHGFLISLQMDMI